MTDGKECEHGFWQAVDWGDFVGRKYTHWKPLQEPPKGE